MKNTLTSEPSIGSPRSDNTNLNNQYAHQKQIVINLEKVERLYRDTLGKKNKYKERAKKYKAILRKRDKEVMDLIIETKDAKS